MAASMAAARCATRAHEFLVGAAERVIVVSSRKGSCRGLRFVAEITRTTCLRRPLGVRKELGKFLAIVWKETAAGNPAADSKSAWLRGIRTMARRRLWTG